MKKQGESKCPHCKAVTLSGKSNGCANCGKVKHTASGRVGYRDRSLDTQARFDALLAAVEKVVLV